MKMRLAIAGIIRAVPGSNDFLHAAGLKMVVGGLPFQLVRSVGLPSFSWPRQLDLFHEAQFGGDHIYV